VESLKGLFENVGLLIDAAGVAAITLATLTASIRFLASLLRKEDGYQRFRQDLGRGILLGLEFLVAGDIIRTVAVEPTLESVSVLGLVVLIRSFLSLTLEVELQGTFPWRRAGALAEKPPEHSVSD
jgi:uncharacterized membrane protein